MKSNPPQHPYESYDLKFASQTAEYYISTLAQKHFRPAVQSFCSILL